MCLPFLIHKEESYRGLSPIPNDGKKTSWTFSIQMDKGELSAPPPSPLQHMQHSFIYDVLVLQLRFTSQKIFQ